MPKSLFWRQADAIGGHPTQAIISAVYHARIARPRQAAARIAMEEDDNDTARGLFGQALSSVGGLARERAQSVVACAKARADGRGASGACSRLRRPSF